MIEILMLLGVIAIWFVLSLVSTLLANRALNSKIGHCKYRTINTTGRKRGRNKAIALMFTMGPFFGIMMFYMIRAMVEMHQGKIVLEEV